MAKTLHRLRRDTTGNVAMIFALLLPVLLLISGAGVDIAKHELLRVELQTGLDRGVLAAASLSQTKGTREILDDYLKNLDYAAELNLTYQEQININSRKITASAVYPMKTAFLNFIGIKVLNVSASSAATEAKQNIELSLMLDLSGSMSLSNRLPNMKAAAKSFIDQILTDQTRDYTSVSIVPYAGEVSVGTKVFDALGGNRVQSTNSCFELKATDYGTSAPNFKERAQVPVFTRWNFGRTNMNWWWCPTDDTAITYPTNDALELKSRIDKLVMHDGTGTQNAVQWGYMLLDPGSRSIINAALSAGQMNSKFKDRPAAFNDPDTMKIIVLMTDGEITEQVRQKDTTKDPFTYWSDSNYTIITSAAVSATRFNSVCTVAKSKGVTVFTIGFEVTGAAVTQMTNCATSPAHFYKVTGTGIKDAFKSISTTINKLRLSQ